MRNFGERVIEVWNGRGIVKWEKRMRIEVGEDVVVLNVEIDCSGVKDCEQCQDIKEAIYDGIVDTVTDVLSMC